MEAIYILDSGILRVKRFNSNVTMLLRIISFLALIGPIVAQEFDSVTATTPQMIRHYNYPVESRRVTTEDGYILTMHRIPGSPSNPTAGNKPIVFLMHGFLLSSFDWVLTGPDKAFAFILADAGYDVWMGNARGNVYSRNHVNRTRLTRREYWHFDWHEIGYYDLPAMIDYILGLTGQENLFYIGHSQGTTVFFVLNSVRPEYNSKFKAMFALAPVAYTEYLSSPPLVIAAQFTYSIEAFSQLFGIYEIKPSDRLIAEGGRLLCNDKSLTQEICSNFLFILYGYDPEQLNNTLLPTIYGHFPAGSSVRQAAHYGQDLKSGKFRWYDHTPVGNLRIYGSLEPPDYDLGAITCPVHLMYGANDFLADPLDVYRAYSELGNVIELFRVEFAKWAHLDFLWGIDAPRLVYEHVLSVIRESYSSD